MNQHMKCDLQKYLSEMTSTLPTAERQKSTFSAKDFSQIPDSLETDQLVIKKEHHDYEGASRVDALRFFAQKATYQHLGLLILSVVFRPGGTRTRVVLTDSQSTVKNLIIEYKGFTQRGFEYRTRPDHFFFFPGRVETHPWTHQHLDLFGLPTFKLTNLKECVITEQDWAQRDTVTGFGNDDASVRLADLLLRLGSPRNETTEVVLEGEGGFRGVGVHSAEVAFYLPGSLAWPSSAPSGHP
jgi:hypothetical protein